MEHTRPCLICGAEVNNERWRIGYKMCMPCGESAAREVRKSWTVLTPHKQGAMFVTAEAARELAVGINNKGGLVK